ncbi:MAG: kelch repeat-containing protein [Planctomycetota bacterium]
MNCTSTPSRVSFAVVLGFSAAVCAAQPSRVSPPSGDVRVTRPPLLPRAIASFGACRVGGWLYVFGGHIGRAHAHSRDNVVGTFQRLNLADGQSWQALPDGPAVQGTALVAAPDGSVYRVGGVTAHNAPSEDADMHSTATVTRFDPDVGEWEEMTPLPEPRSSHDAIVCDNHLYVIGGWNLEGEDGETWHETAWVTDLAQQPLEWRALPPIGETRRACAVATFDGKVAVLGGIDEADPLSTVRVFDPTSGQWSDGPELPGTGFGTAALGLDKRLYATVMEGRLLSWGGEGEWQPVAQLEMPRFFHRMVPGAAPDQILAFGGAGRGGHMRMMETIHVGAEPQLELREYVIPAPGKVAHRQALMLLDNTLWAFGGNRGGRGGDRFAPERFATDVWRVDLTSMTASHVADLPAGAQSMAAATWGGRGKNLIVGGLGVQGDGVQSLASAWRWNGRRGEAQSVEAALPAPRTQLQMVHHDNKLYVIGGVDFTPDERGGTTKGDTGEILVCDADATELRFEPSGIQLPRPRRSFGAAVIGERLYLVGGLGNGFSHAGPCDVYDFATGTWSELDAPAAWVSPQVAAVGDRLYVACGGTMKGQRFSEDRSLWAFERGSGWTAVIEELPFPVRHVQMIPQRNRLVFYAANDERGDRIVLRILEPDARVQVLEPSFHR